MKTKTVIIIVAAVVVVAAIAAVAVVAVNKKKQEEASRRAAEDKAISLGVNLGVSNKAIGPLAKLAALFVWSRDPEKKSTILESFLYICNVIQG